MADGLWQMTHFLLQVEHLIITLLTTLACQCSRSWRVYRPVVSRTLTKLQIEAPEYERYAAFALDHDTAELGLKLKALAASVRRPAPSPPQRPSKLPVKLSALKLLWEPRQLQRATRQEWQVGSQ